MLMVGEPATSSPSPATSGTSSPPWPQRPHRGRSLARQQRGLPMDAAL